MPKQPPIARINTQDGGELGPAKEDSNCFGHYPVSRERKRGGRIRRRLHKHGFMCSHAVAGPVQRFFPGKLKTRMQDHKRSIPVQTIFSLEGTSACQK